MKRRNLIVGLVAALLVMGIGIAFGLGEPYTEEEREDYELLIQKEKGGNLTIEYGNEKEVLTYAYDGVWNGSIEEDTEVEIIAEPHDEYVFTGWEGDHLEERSMKELITVEMDRDREIKAGFSEDHEWVPYIPLEEKTEISFLENGTRVEVEITFSNAGYRVKDWGNITGTENRKEVNANIERWTGAAAEVVTTLSNVYELDDPDECFEFVFEAHGEIVKTADFCDTKEELLAEDSDDQAITESEVIEIVEEAGFEVPDNASLNQKDDDIWSVKWFDDPESEEGMHLFEVNIEKREIMRMIIPPPVPATETVIPREEISTHVKNELREIENINLPEKIEETDYTIKNETDWVQMGWSLRWNHEIDDIPVERSHVTAEISKFGEIAYYGNNWADIEEDEISTEAKINEEEAIELANKAFSPVNETDEEMIDLYDEVNASLSIARPFSKSEELERDYKLLYNVRFTQEDGTFFIVQVDAEDGEIVGSSGSRIIPQEENPIEIIPDVLPFIVLGGVTLLIIVSVINRERRQKDLVEDRYDKMSEKDEIDWSEYYTKDQE